jgi:hypothetical protein
MLIVIVVGRVTWLIGDAFQRLPVANNFLMEGLLHMGITAV